MNADDPRHGTVAGYLAGCRADCCRTACVRYEKQRVHERRNGRPRRLDPTGTHRRIRALMAIGWTMQAIAHAAGWEAFESVNSALKKKHVLRATHDRISDAYDQLSMTPGPSERTRKLGESRGWAPPLAWDDATIDDPEAEPYRSRRRSVRDRETGQVLQPTTNHVEQQIVDHVIVNRALNGQKVDATPVERVEIARRWHAAGRSTESLNDLQGWNLHRDARKAAA